MFEGGKGGGVRFRVLVESHIKNKTFTGLAAVVNQRVFRENCENVGIAECHRRDNS